jgi:anti-anti-sigma regulatory factor
VETTDLADAVRVIEEWARDHAAPVTGEMPDTAKLDAMREGDGRLIVDLRATRSIDSTGLNALVMVHRHAAQRRQSVLLRGVGEELRYLLVLTKLDTLFGMEGGGSEP